MVAVTLTDVREDACTAGLGPGLGLGGARGRAPDRRGMHVPGMHALLVQRTKMSGAAGIWHGSAAPVGEMGLLIGKGGKVCFLEGLALGTGASDCGLLVEIAECERTGPAPKRVVRVLGDANCQAGEQRLAHKYDGGVHVVHVRHANGGDTGCYADASLEREPEGLVVPALSQDALHAVSERLRVGVARGIQRTTKELGAGGRHDAGRHEVVHMRMVGCGHQDRGCQDHACEQRLPCKPAQNGVLRSVDRRAFQNGAHYVALYSVHWAVDGPCQLAPRLVEQVPGDGQHTHPLETLVLLLRRSELYVFEGKSRAPSHATG